MTRHHVLCDVETNGLNHEIHQAIEVAWLNRATGERGRFIPRHNVSDVLAAAEIPALRINRYIDRIPGQLQDIDGAAAARLWEQFVTWDETTETRTAHTLAGSNPRFDAAFLSKVFLSLPRLEDCDPEPWKHRLSDLGSYACGVLGLDPAEPPGLEQVCQLLGIPGEGPVHTAEGGVDAADRCFSELQRRAGLAAISVPTSEGA